MCVHARARVCVCVYESLSLSLARFPFSLSLYHPPTLDVQARHLPPLSAVKTISVFSRTPGPASAKAAVVFAIPSSTAESIPANVRRFVSLMIPSYAAEYDSGTSAGACTPW